MGDGEGLQRPWIKVTHKYHPLKLKYLWFHSVLADLQYYQTVTSIQRSFHVNVDFSEVSDTLLSM
jgi:hypothetical protein